MKLQLGFARVVASSNFYTAFPDILEDESDVSTDFLDAFRKKIND